MTKHVFELAGCNSKNATTLEAAFAAMEGAEHVKVTGTARGPYVLFFDMACSKRDAFEKASIAAAAHHVIVVVK